MSDGLRWLVDGLVDKSFRRLSASPYFVDIQRNIEILIDVVDIFTNTFNEVFLHQLYSIGSSILLLGFQSTLHPQERRDE